jgi:group I intron endonuclease
MKNNKKVKFSKEFIKNDDGNNINNSLIKNKIISKDPVIFYENVETMKIDILKANKGKTGIYMWTSKKYGKSYIGSAIDLSKRFGNYFSLSYLETKKSNSVIYKALLKYSYSNFTLEIMEYCDKNSLISREQYYIDSLKPEYNICKIAGSSLGFKHSEETKIKMSFNNTGISNPRFGKRHTPESREKISNSLKLKLKVYKFIKPEVKLKLSLRSVGISVKVYDKCMNLVNQYSSLIKAAKDLNVSEKTIGRVYKTGKSYNNFIYIFEIKDNRVWIYDYNHKLIKILNNTKKVSEWYKIPYSTVARYIKTGKLYKNKYYFYNISKV